MDPFLLAALAFGGFEVGKAFLDLFGGYRAESTKRMELGLQEKQMKAAAGMGRREELRAEKLMEKMLQQQDKVAMQERGTEERLMERSAASEENQMLMSLIAAVAGLNQQTTQQLNRPRPSRMSIMGMMR